MVHIDLEGGFWGIKGEDGMDYRPVDPVPKEFQKESLMVAATATPFEGVSIFMWGRPVHIQQWNTYNPFKPHGN